MPHDGVNYQNLSLSPPVHGHPEAPAVGDALHDGLAGAYMVSRKHANYLGATTYRQYLRNRYANHRNQGMFAQTSMVKVGRIVSYVPAQATHAGAVITFRSHGYEPSTAHARIISPSTTGDTFSQAVDSFPDTAYRPVSNIFGGGRAFQFVPFFFGTQEIFTEVDLSGDSLPLTGTFDAEMYLVGESGSAVYCRPELVTFYWWAED